jgi:protein TonB
VSRHLDLETLSALLDSELAPAAAAAAQTHLAECAECRARLEGLRSTVSQLRALPAASPPPHVHEALRRRLAMEESTRRRLWAPPGWPARLAGWPATVAASFLALACGLLLHAYLSRHPSLPPIETPLAAEGEWRATITYERASGAEAPPAEEAPTGPPAPKVAAQSKPSAPRREYAPAPASPPAAAPEPMVSADAELKERSRADAAADALLAEQAKRERAAVQTAAEAAAPANAAAKAAPAPSASGPMAAAGQAEPGMSPPVRIAGANPDLGSLGKLRWRQSLILIEGTVGVDGALHDVDIRPGDLDPRIGGLLRRTIATWRFEPARKNGEPVPVRYVVTLNIDLQ